jgi:hypothetical protein
MSLFYDSIERLMIITKRKRTFRGDKGIIIWKIKSSALKYPIKLVQKFEED